MPKDRLDVVPFPSTRERRAREVREKLGSVSRASSITDRVVDDLAQQDASREAEKVRSRVRSREAKGFGPKRIAAELRDQGVEPELIEACVDTREEYWLDRARQYVVKKYARDLMLSHQTPDSQEREKIRNRIARNLTNRGFHFGAIAKTLEELLAPLED